MSSFPFLSLDFFNQLPLMFNTSSISSPITLEAAGLIVLADLPAVASRTALTGGASFLDALVLVPGMHQQQCADEINRGEFPTTGAMNSGYVFRVENPATVSYLQTIGQAGNLVTARVSQNPFQNTDLSLCYGYWVSADSVHESTYACTRLSRSLAVTRLYFLLPSPFFFQMLEYNGTL
ncbi:uncharacterized protein ARMOST_07587 [Armillaria ostoyae]|uniref:Uncharacterized protein n=1 Tax=Armillaria ostoyae TaxID=47428 RepID=A0A284R678_ARMOS|nr:uncharacterized protein ARMOST_07587 [Armillaria ostoyae]